MAGRTAVIGAGPAGLACAQRLASGRALSEVVVFEKGRDLEGRVCPVDRGGSCHGCQGTCNVISGFGGCMHHGDSIKLSRFPAGRRLRELLGDEYDTLEREAMAFFEVAPSDFSAAGEPAWGRDVVRAYPVAEIAEERLAALLRAKRKSLSQASEVRLGSRVTAVRPCGRRFEVTAVAEGSTTTSTFDAVVVATGRSGLGDAGRWLASGGVKRERGRASLGVRIELPRQLLAPLYAVHKDFKLSLRRSGRKTKTFCFSAHPETGGRIKYCHYQDQFDAPVVFLDGHTSYSSAVTVGNFALLRQITERDAESWFQGEFLPRYRLRAGGFPVWQPLAELLGTPSAEPVGPSVPAMSRGEIGELVPADVLADLLASFTELAEEACRRSGASLAEYVERGVVMAPAVEFLWDTVGLSGTLETSVEGLYVIGDCAGWAQGNLQAAVMGLSVGRRLGA